MAGTLKIALHLHPLNYIKKIVMKKYLMYAAMLVLAACNGNKDEKAKVEDVPAAPLTNSKNSDTFNKAFTALMDDYFHLKDNFITEKDSVINFYAQKITKDADALPLAELKGDATINELAKSLVDGIKSELKGLRDEKDLKAKRKSFNMLTDQMYNLVRTVKYDREIVYHQHCPMAFTEGDENGYWLSRSSDIKNPYLPKTMLTCGDVADSLNYTK